MAQSEKKIRDVWKCEWEEHEEFHDDDGKHISEELFPPTIYYSQCDERRRENETYKRACGGFPYLPLMNPS